MAETWLKCTECKKDIPYGGKHYVCSVSTCKRSKFRLVFCTPTCWDSHLSTVRHREAWAEDAVAPTKEAWARELAESATPAPAPAPTPVAASSSAPVVRRVVGDASPAVAAQLEGLKLSDVTDKDILIVVSKMKKYIKDRSGFNCSDAVADMLSDHVRAICDDAIRMAARDERKTVLDRDVPRARR
jgi:histone H3/H4